MLHEKEYRESEVGHSRFHLGFYPGMPQGFLQHNYSLKLTEYCNRVYCHGFSRWGRLLED